MSKDIILFKIRINIPKYFIDVYNAKKTLLSRQIISYLKLPLKYK